MQLFSICFNTQLRIEMDKNQMSDDLLTSLHNLSDRMKSGLVISSR